MNNIEETYDRIKDFICQNDTTVIKKNISNNHNSIEYCEHEQNELDLEDNMKNSNKKISSNDPEEAQLKCNILSMYEKNNLVVPSNIIVRKEFEEHINKRDHFVCDNNEYDLNEKQINEDHIIKNDNTNLNSLKEISLNIESKVTIHEPVNMDRPIDNNENEKNREGDMNCTYNDITKIQYDKCSHKELNEIGIINNDIEKRQSEILYETNKYDIFLNQETIMNKNKLNTDINEHIEIHINNENNYNSNNRNAIVQAEKLNSDIPYITNIYKEMHRSPVMPLRIEAFHSLEDQRLIYGKPDWQKFLCPLCDKKYYPPNSYIKNYTHYLNEHWMNRKILGGYIIFPCKLIHEKEDMEQSKTNMHYINKGIKKKKKKTKKILIDPHYHCPLCVNMYFYHYNMLTEHCSNFHKNSGADPSRTLPSNLVHTPFINSNDYI